MYRRMASHTFISPTKTNQVCEASARGEREGRKGGRACQAHSAVMFITNDMAGSSSAAEYTAHSSGPTTGSHGAVYQL